jgi:hypothetical protein
MNRALLLSLVGFMAPALVTTAADPKTDVFAAIRKLAEKSGYTWTTTPNLEGVEANWRPGPTDGKAEKGGFTYYKSSMGEYEYEVAFRGPRSAFKGRSDWQSADELEANDRGWIARRLRAFKAPVAEAEEFALNTRNWKKGEGTTYAGELTEEGVKLYFARGRRSTSPAAMDVKGLVTYWVKDGLLQKYEYKVEGTVSVGQENRDKMALKLKALVEIKDVGNTRVVLPDEARAKLQ